ncbi:helix-turn-helix transcriptional regulator [Aeromicrobium sp. CF3.5]|uniref:helix-turn-helix transcriptional regulator n=1 Tax=Aeromicrobium sp. CF3.5 TaxID=3373078 RepID=UPI003EE50CAC
MSEAERAVARVVERINGEYSDELTIDDLAETAFYSKFHFTRVFHRLTGVTPGRFLSAVRIQKAKELLLRTDLTVTEISHGVGYASCGTFSSRFAQSVGVSPSAYRALGGFRPVTDTSGTCDPPDQRPDPTTSSTIHGRVEAEGCDLTGLIFVGVFSGPVHEGKPIRSVVLDGPGHFTLDSVPAGDWYVMACSASASASADDRDGASQVVGSSGPLTLRPGVAAVVDLALHTLRLVEPPVLLARMSGLESRPVRYRMSV